MATRTNTTETRHISNPSPNTDHLEEHEFQHVRNMRTETAKNLICPGAEMNSTGTDRFQRVGRIVQVIEARW